MDECRLCFGQMNDEFGTELKPFYDYFTQEIIYVHPQCAEHLEKAQQEGAIL